MTITPFLALKLRGNKDALLARQRARRIASILAFDPTEQACIAAGVFLIACQALERFGKARLYFQIENRQLEVFAAQGKTLTGPAAGRLQGMFPEDAQPGLRLVKPIPSSDRAFEDSDLGWIVEQVGKMGGRSLFAEIVQQNQEILRLLRELQSYRAVEKLTEEKARPPHAA